jgi:hypothetical protein
MWVHMGIRCGGGFRWKLGIPRCTQIHTSLIVNQAYACATANSTVSSGARATLAATLESVATHLVVPLTRGTLSQVAVGGRGLRRRHRDYAGGGEAR